ncbi:hypothetical protein M441DRAFT_289311 [Trichoderma asperellum CBS 433.97]|uniref:Uncharacterized protein n=1 Tax=Trichoderma asperellum (strain ATCC 204424 / CBS 433.97 / NBRC 101777) TaxID=1042311 RepID=A0A2T3YTR5_TRIA4|nr:hypothetical protein M441DRAFT_289311 [Trichoderma asperellum CBS 433.97]PTB35958.1 hypothetical protein M441DRAFT_289311 [Trichoderma asperellum CBS 433.97]
MLARGPCQIFILLPGANRIRAPWAGAKRLPIRRLVRALPLPGRVAASKSSASTCGCGHWRHRGTWRSDLGLTAHGQLPPGAAAILAMASLTPCHATLSLPGPSDSPPCTCLSSTSMIRCREATADAPMPRSTACKQHPSPTSSAKDPPWDGLSPGLKAGAPQIFFACPSRVLDR